MTRRASVTQTAIKRATKAALEAGLRVTGVRVTGETIEVLTADESQPRAGAFDQWEAKRNARHAQRD